MDAVLRLGLDLIQPLTLAWLLLAVWLLRAAWLRLWRWTLLPAVAWLLLTVISCTPLASWVMMHLENEHPLPEQAATQGADAIVCLGGGVQPSLKEPTGIHLMRGGDRLVTAFSMAASGMAPVLVLGGGGYEEEGVMHSEADGVLAFMQRFEKLPFESVSLGACAHTRDEAVRVAALAKERGWKKVLLVTSAAHMKRSVGTFETAGVPGVVPVPCHYMSSFHQIGDKHWWHLPYAGSFEIFDSWFHEIIGTWIYRWRGWMK